jgi:hypothetical protein
MNLQKEKEKKNHVLLASGRSLTKRAGPEAGSASGSVRYQNVTDQEYWKLGSGPNYVFISKFFLAMW